MSEWIEIKNQEDVELSDDGKHIEVLYNTNRFGNQYIEIPVKFITRCLTGHTMAEGLVIGITIGIILDKIIHWLL